jgi:hypothetical protein
MDAEAVHGTNGVMGATRGAAEVEGSVLGAMKVGEAGDGGVA